MRAHAIRSDGGDATRVDYGRHGTGPLPSNLRLSATEDAVLAELLRCSPAALSYTWAEERGYDRHWLRVNVSRVRARLRERGIEIRTEPRLGYRLELADSAGQR